MKAQLVSRPRKEDAPAPAECRRNRIRILNVEFDDVTLDWLVEHLIAGMVITANVDSVMKMQRDGEFYEIQRCADFVVADGQLLVFGARFLGTPLRERVTGSDLLPALCWHHRANPDVRVFLLGAGPGVAQEAQRRINARAGRDVVVGAHGPSFGFERDEDESRRIAEMIDGSGATVLAVGVGAPKQEKWIIRHRSSMPGVRLYLPVGAALDFAAGRIRRAPRWMQRSGLEWSHRLVREPARLWRRYLIEDPPFFKLLLQQRLGQYQDPFA